MARRMSDGVWVLLIESSSVLARHAPLRRRSALPRRHGGLSMRS